MLITHKATLTAEIVDILRMIGNVRDLVSGQLLRN